MNIFAVIAVLVVIGVILGLVVKFVPMEANMKNILVGAVCIFVVLWLLSLFFGDLGFANIKVGH